MNIAITRSHRNSGRPPEKDAPKFLEWIRKTHKCVFHLDGDCEGKVEAMHLDFAGGKGVATKVADRYSVPACSKHHGRQHTKGWVTFLKEVGVTKEALLRAADKLWGSWPGRFKWEMSRAA
jgi:hypothetical protein